MAATTKPFPTPARGELVITRVFDAPRALVWRAWTEPEHFKRWWGPRDFTAPVAKIDLRAGGTYLWCMRSPEGQDFWTTGVYRDIVPLERLVYTDAFADADGNVVPASRYGMAGDWPSETAVTVTFEELAGKTKLTLRHVGIPSGAMRDMTGTGWSESFDKLAVAVGARNTRALTVILPSDREIVMTRVFDAPRRLVFEAHTTCEHMKHWWGPRRHTFSACDMDFRPGGAWRIVQRKPDGTEYAFRGVYREIVPPERIVQTFEFEGMPGHISVETLTLVERDGKTTLTNRSLLPTAEARDGMLQSGMEEGASESWDRLAEYVASMKA